MAKRKSKRHQGRDRVVKSKKDKKKKGLDRNPKREAQMKRLRRFGRIMLWIFGSIAVLIGILVALAAIYEDKIANSLLTQVNKGLKEPIEVKEIELNLVRSFPNASVDFQEIKIPDTYGDALLMAEELSFKFNALSLLSNTFKIKSIVANDGYLNLHKDAQGNVNYNISKNSNSDEEASNGDSNFAIDIQNTVFKNIILDYVDETHNQSAEIYLEYLDLSGNFSGKRTKVKTNAEIVSKFVNINGDRYLPNATISWDFGIDADFENGVYTLDDSSLDLEANTFKAVGKVLEDGDAFDADIQLNGDDCTIRSIIALLPDRYKNLIRDFNSKGNFYFNVDINGKYSDNQTPAINAEFGLKDGQVTSPRLGESLKDVNFAATFKSSQNQDSAVFNMPGLVAKLDNQLLSVDLKVEDVKDPRIDFRFNGDVNMGLVYKLSNNDYIKDGSGMIKFQDLIVIGRFKDMTDPNRLNRVDASGIINTENFKLKYKDELFRMQDGYLTFTNELLTVRKLQLFGAESDFLFNLNVYNVLPVVLKDTSDVNSKNIKIRFDGEMRSNNINFDKLLELGLTQDENQAPVETVPTSDSSDIDEVDYVSRTKGRFSAYVKRFNFRKVSGRNFQGTVEYNNKELIFKDVGVEVMDGKMMITSNLRLKGKPRLEAYIETDDIDGKRFFEEAENFGQKELTDKNVKGRIDSKILVNAFWDEDFNFLDDKLYVLMDLTIREGELINFKMMEDFSQFVKIEDLKRIKFTDMRNQLSIKKSVLTVPSMFIQSNALNLTLAGKYGFNSDVDFKFKINAGQVIANKFKRFNPLRNPKKARKNGWFNIYVGMKGNLYGKLDFDYTDKRDAKAMFEKLKVEFKDIPNTVKNKFQTDDVSEPLDWDDSDDGSNDDDGEWGEF